MRELKLCTPVEILIASRSDTGYSLIGRALGKRWFIEMDHQLQEVISTGSDKRTSSICIKAIKKARLPIITGAIPYTVTI